MPHFAVGYFNLFYFIMVNLLLENMSLPERVLDYPILPFNKTIRSYLKENITIGIPLTRSNILQLTIEDISIGCCIRVRQGHTEDVSICDKGMDYNISEYTGSLQISLINNLSAHNCSDTETKTTLEMTVFNKCIGNKRFILPGTTSYRQPCRHGNSSGCTLAVCQGDGNWLESQCDISVGSARCNKGVTGTTVYVTESMTPTTQNLLPIEVTGATSGTTEEYRNGSTITTISTDDNDIDIKGQSPSNHTHWIDKSIELKPKDKIIALWITITILVFGVSIVFFMIIRLIYRTRSKPEEIRTISSNISDCTYKKSIEMTSLGPVESLPVQSRVKNPCYISINGDFSESNTDDDVSQTSNASSGHVGAREDKHNPKQTFCIPQSSFPESLVSKGDPEKSHRMYHKKPPRDVKVYPRKHESKKTSCTFTRKNGCLGEYFCQQNETAFPNNTRSLDQIYAVSYKKHLI